MSLLNKGRIIKTEAVRNAFTASVFVWTPLGSTAQFGGAAECAFCVICHKIHDSSYHVICAVLLHFFSTTTPPVFQME